MHRDSDLPVVSVHRIVACTLGVGLAVAAAAATPASGPGGASLISGIDSQYADDGVRIQDDFYRHVNGKWLALTPIPADKSAYDSWYQLADDSQTQLRGIVEGLLQAADPSIPISRRSLTCTRATWMRRRWSGWVRRRWPRSSRAIDALHDKQQIALADRAL